MKLLETSKDTTLKNQKEQSWKKYKRENCLTSSDNKKVFRYFYFFGKFIISKTLKYRSMYYKWFLLLHFSNTDQNQCFDKSFYN